MSTTLIDGDKLYLHFNDWAFAIAPDERHDEREAHNRQIAYSTIMDAMQAICDAPTIDAVPVVRCKDCKWWDNVQDFGRCKRHVCISMREDGFCSLGERRDNE